MNVELQPNDRAPSTNSRLLDCLREPEFWLLALLVAGVYFSRLTDLVLKGEETRRGLVAIEMLRTGDWIVPSLQGDVYFMSNRPPLQQWIIASLGWLRGGVDAFAVRFPSAVAVLLTTWLVYAYGRPFLKRAGAFAAAVAFATMGQVLELGRLGESDPLFTFFLSGSLLLWHAGRTLGWPDWRTWSLGYLFAALATLTKGPQAPVYFAGGVGLSLLVTRRWRDLFARGHLAGIAAFLAVWGPWQLAFFLRTDLDAVRYIYFGDVVRYGEATGVLSILRHVLLYPLKLFACLLPWTVFFVTLVRRDLRGNIVAGWAHLLFLAGAIAITFPTVWFVHGAQSRFYMPLYPCFALIVGLIAQRSFDAAPGEALKNIWGRFITSFALLMFPAGVALLAISSLGPELVLIAQPLGQALLICLVTLMLSIVAFRVRNAVTHGEQVVGTLCVGAFAGLVFNWVILNTQVANAFDKADEVAAVEKQLPDGAAIYSLNHVDHGFAFYLDREVGLIDWPEPHEDLPEDVQYFCFRSHDWRAGRPFQFAWEPVAFVHSETHGKEDFPPKLVVIARRLPGDNRRDTLAVVREAYLSRQADSRQAVRR